MDGTAFERIVVILAVGGGAVDERRAERIERAGVTDRRAQPSPLACRERGG